VGIAAFGGGRASAFRANPSNTAKAQRFAVVRWITHDGDSPLRLFGPPGHPRVRLVRSEDRDEEQAIHDLAELYSGPQLFQASIVGRSALIEIGAALKGVPAPYGNAYGNTR
jgi:hypothetical protein